MIISGRPETSLLIEASAQLAHHETLLIHSGQAETPTRAAEIIDTGLYFMSGFNTRRIRAGTILYHQGASLKTVYMLDQGFVLATQRDEEDHIQFSEIARPVSILGTEALSGRQSYDNLATAFTDCTIAAMPSECLLFEMRRDPMLRGFFLSHHLVQMDRQNRRFREREGQKAPRRVAATLIELAAIEGLPRDRITQSVFSGFVGVTRESVNKAITDLRRRGIITWKLGVGFTIEQESVLREIAEGSSK